jgi:hypothetical protein
MCAKNAIPGLRFCTGGLARNKYPARNAEEMKSKGYYPFSDSHQAENSQAQHLSPAVPPVRQKAATAVDKRKIETISNL